MLLESWIRMDTHWLKMKAFHTLTWPTRNCIHDTNKHKTNKTPRIAAYPPQSQCSRLRSPALFKTLQNKRWNPTLMTLKKRQGGNHPMECSIEPNQLREKWIFTNILLLYKKYSIGRKLQCIVLVSLSGKVHNHETESIIVNTWNVFCTCSMWFPLYFEFIARTLLAHGYALIKKERKMFYAEKRKGLKMHSGSWLPSVWKKQANTILEHGIVFQMGEVPSQSWQQSRIYSFGGLLVPPWEVRGSARGSLKPLGLGHILSLCYTPAMGLGVSRIQRKQWTVAYKEIFNWENK